jgi:capsular polysaccharide biosynthesis protein
VTAFGLIPAAATERDILLARRGLYYASTPPRSFGFECPDPAGAAQVAALFARPRVACPDEFVAELAGVVLVGGSFVLTESGRGVAESFAEAGEMATAEHMAAPLARLRARDWATPAAGLPVVHIFTAAGANYGHLLVDILPRLVNVAEAGLRRFAIPVPAHAMPLWPVVQWSAARLGLDVEPIVCAPGTLLRPERLVWAGPVSLHNRRKSPTLKLLAERLAVLRADARRRLFVTRPPGANRAMANQAALEAMARGAGWEVVEPSGLAFPEQVALFGGAARVLGPLGAGLCNAMFMPPGGRLSMISGVRFDVFFWDMACALGQGFDWVFTEPMAPYRPAHLWAPAPLRLERLAEALAWLER